MQGYVYTPASNDEIDIKIAENKNKIQELNEENNRLRLEKSKSNKQYIGRCFEMKDGEHILVIGTGWDDNEPYGISFEFFEYSCDIYKCVKFDESKIENEVTLDEFKRLLNDNIKIDKLIDILGCNKTNEV